MIKINSFQLDCLRNIRLLTKSLLPDTVTQKNIVAIIEKLANEIEQEEIKKKV